MTTLNQLFDAIGHEQLSVQQLNTNLLGVKTKGRDALVTFGTPRPANDIITGRITGLIVWMNSDRYNQALNKIKEPANTDLVISKFQICQLAMMKAIAAELNRQCPGLNAEQQHLAAITDAANVVCQAINAAPKAVEHE
ncbi:hypothetical protein [Vibrio sp. H11]|uniref:hypothetical protein n=1 Tax=Vibrio sp. H11 TaxID=2565928 RepID=UPI0010A661F9|nr:hypothetical protein [Vibrio sp. H11]